MSIVSDCSSIGQIDEMPTCSDASVRMKAPSSSRCACASSAGWIEYESIVMSSQPPPMIRRESILLLSTSSTSCSYEVCSRTRRLCCRFSSSSYFSLASSSFLKA